MGRSSGYLLEGKPAQPADTTTRLAEALLGAELSKKPCSVLIRCDSPRDTAIVHKTLVGLRDGYVPPRK
jgi:hypothetical protein